MLQQRTGKIIVAKREKQLTLITTDYTGYLCWEPREAEQVLDADALQVPPGVFRAVHYPVQFYRRNPLLGEREGVPRWDRGVLYGEQQFLSDLLYPEANYRLVAVIGRSGSGKSHLIRWIAARTPETLDRRVILVPRAGTNLREVIRRILKGMQGDIFEQFRQRLMQAAEPVTEEQGRARLLDRLAEAIEFNSGEDEALLADQPPALHRYISHAAKEAPSFLRDPYFRRQWLRQGGVLARLYDLTLGSAQEIDRLDERRQFQEDDLPQNIADVTEASKVTQRFYRHLVREANADLRKALLLVLNRYLDEAIRGLLNLESEDLASLLREVRRTLEQEGRELVLLIEDVARLQGIDRQLLDALLERPESDEGRLCSLRAVVGCTDGYFGTLPNTFRTRCSFLVDLNVDPTDAGASGDVIAPMAAGYLNAARAGVAELEAWHKENPESAPLPNKCDDCFFRERCHEAFGELGGVGLYPFNARALRQMYSRTKAEGINPRFLLHDVLGRVLITYNSDLRAGNFPSPELLQDFGGLSDRWGPEAQRALQRSAVPAEVLRHQALLDLWTEATQPVLLQEPVYEAFNLSLLTNVQKSPTAPQTKETEAPTQTHDGADPKSEGGNVPEFPAKVRELLDALDDWSRGNRLDQTAANDLRKALYSAVRSRIEWDTERLVASVLAQATGSAFRRYSIRFQDQATSKDAEVSFTLPLPTGPNRTDTALALKGLVLYKYHDHWGFEGGAERLQDYARLLESVADEVVRQLRRPADKDWDPALASAELLSLGARLHGEPSSSKTAPEDRLDAMFATWVPVENGEASPEWIRLTQQFAKEQESLRDLFEAYLLCAKGGDRRTKMLDTARIAHVLKKTNLLPRVVLPSALPRRLRVLRLLQEAVDQQLTQALLSEQERWEAWSVKIEAWFGSASLDEVREAILKIRQYLNDQGFQRLTRDELDQLNTRSRGLRESDLIQLRPLAQRIASAEADTDVKRSALARDVGYAVSQRSPAQRLMEYGQLAEAMLEKAETFIKDQSQNIEGGGALDSIFSDIEQTLGTLTNELVDPVGNKTASPVVKEAEA